MSGNITLDRLTQEQTTQGTVEHSYDYPVQVAQSAMTMRLVLLMFCNGSKSGVTRV